MMNEKDKTKSGLDSHQSECQPSVPAIRFEGFCEEWKGQAIGDVFTEHKRPIELKDNELYQLVTVKRRNGGVVPRALLKGRDILVKNYFEIKTGDYLISKRQVVHGATGIVPDSLDNAVVSNEYLVAVENKDITAKFWTLLSKRSDMHKKFFVSSYGVDIEKLVFDVEDWKKREVIISKTDEQNRITDYFQQLDSLISQHQKKHDKLLTVKKSLLEKLFPKQGEAEPEIRFKGFGGEWVEKEVGELFKVTRGSVLAATQTSEKQTRYMPFPVYSSQTKNNGLMGYYKNFLFENAITWTTDGANAGTVNYREGKFYSTNVNGVLLSGEGSANKVVAEILNRTAWKHVSHVGNPKLMNNVMSKIRIATPTLIREQQALSSILSKTDALLSHYEAQLKKLNNIKQACLSKMFV